MRIERKRLSEIKTSNYNPRITLKPGDSAYEKIASSLDEFGQVLPIVWNERTGNIVGGHQRYNILKAKGVKECEVSVVDLPIEKEKALNLALNKLSGEWDNEKLGAIFAELHEDDLDLTGFNSAEIDVLLQTFTDIIDDIEIDLPDLGTMEQPEPGGEANGETMEGNDDKQGPEVETLPPSDESARTRGGIVDVRIGEFSFTVPREVYESWAREIKATSSRRDEIIEEIQIRLGI